MPRSRKTSNEPRRTAPRTHNRTTHGFTAAADIVIAGEYEEDWHEFHDGVIDDLAPVGRLEESLASRAAEILWRIRRATIQDKCLAGTAVESGNRYEQRIQWRNLNARRLAQAKAALAAGEPSPFGPDEPQPVGGLYRPTLVAELEFPDPEPMRFLSPQPTIDLVMRYETHLGRQLVQTLALFDALQRRRAPAMRDDPLPELVTPPEEGEIANDPEN